MKTNDFIVASITNPEYNSELFKDIGMDTSNTLMLSKDKYLSSQFIKENDMFKDDNGEFSEAKFDKFYNAKLAEWDSFSKDSEHSKLKYDLFDYRRFTSPTSKVKNPNISLYRISNPFENTIGEGFINKSYESPLSARELAQKNTVKDFATGKDLGYSPNDHNLFESPLEWFRDIFRDPLVLAQYDDDGTYIDPITGEEKTYKKGDYKLNSEGKLYYETLDGRDVSKKQVLSHWDKLTVDGSALNQFDFMDSDDKEKSIKGCIAKSAVQIAPLFFGGYVYGGLLVGLEILKSLPMLEGFLGSVTNTDTPFHRMANTLSGFGTSFNTSLSDKGQSGFLNPEALAQTMVDVALLWSQQKFISESYHKLMRPDLIQKNAIAKAEQLYKTTAAKLTDLINKEIASLKAAGKVEEAALAAEKLAQQVGDPANWKASRIGASILEQLLGNATKQIEKAGKIGEQLSLMYMIGISNTDVYQDALDAGLSKREALLVTLGSMYGMYYVDAKAHLGEAFFKWTTPENEKQVRNTLRNAQKEWISTIGQNTAVKEKGIKGFFKNAVEKSTGVYNKFLENLKHHGGGFFQKSMEEGLEEVGEEVAADLSKQLYTWASEICPSVFTKGNLNPFQDFGERAAQSFLGGALGGGLFYGVEAYNGQHKLRDESRDKLIYLFNNNDKTTVDRILNEMHKNGELGSTELGYKQVELENGETTYTSPDEDNISQNDFIYNQLKNEIDGIYKIIKDDNLQMSDGQLYDKLTLGDARLLRLVLVLKDQNENYQAGYIQRYNKLTSEYITKKQELLDATKELPDTASAEDKKLLQEKISTILGELSTLKEEIDKFKTGENAIDYAGRMLFEMDERLSTPFSNIVSFKAYLKNTKHIDPEKFETLDITLQEAIKQEYLAEKKTFDIEEAWTQFKLIRDDLTPEFVNILDKAKVLLDYIKQMLDLLDPEKNPLNNIKTVNLDDLSETATDPDFKINWSDSYDGESTLDYEKAQRDDVTEFPSEDEYNTFKANRLNKLKESKALVLRRRYETEAFRKVQDIITNCGGVLDKTTKRQILLSLGTRLVDIINAQLKRQLLHTLSLFKDIQDSFSSAIKTIKPDLSNIDEVKRSLIDSALPILKLKLSNYIHITEDLRILNPGKVTAKDILDIIINENERRQKIIDELNNLGFLIAGTNKIDAAALNTIGITEGMDFAEASNILSNLGLSRTLINTIIYNNGGNTIIKDLVPPIMKINTSSLERDAYIRSVLSDYSDENVALEILNITDDSTGELDFNKIADTLNGTTEGVLLDKVFDDVLYEAMMGGYVPDGDVFHELKYDVPESDKQQVFKILDSQFNFFANQVKSEEAYKFIQAINDAKPVDNPIISIVKKIGLSLNKDVSDVEDLLETLMNNDMSLKGVDEFTLSEPLRVALNEAYDLLELAKSFIYSTFNSKSTAYPYPHNQLINQLRKENGFDGDELPVIDDEVAELYYGQMLALQDEIGHETNDENGYTVGSWRYWDYRNQVNKSLQFIQTDKAFTATKLKFFDVYKRDLTGISEGISFDLLQGYDTISGDDEERLFKIELLFYNNITKLLNDNPTLTLSKIFDACGIKIKFFRDLESLVSQFTTVVGPKMSITDLTAMDKSLYLLSLTCLNPSDYIAEIEKSLSFDETAPLSGQLYNSRLGIAYSKNTKLFNEGLDWIHSNVSATDFNKQTIIYGLFISGGAGAGKTSVVLRDIVNSTNKKVIAVAPSDSQLKSFKNLPSSVEKLNKEQLFKLILDGDTYNEIIAESNSTAYSTYCLKQTGFTGDFPVINPTAVKSKFKEVADLHILAIDEATHYSTLELSILSEYCKEKGIALILIGDDYQNGTCKGNFAENLNMENVFTARSPRLGVTIRDGNYQKLENNNRMAHLVKRLLATPIEDSRRKLYIQDSINTLKNLTLLHYDGSEINGDLFTDDLSEDQLEKLKLAETIGFLGDESSPLALKLKSKGFTNIEFIKSPVEMQGREFSVMISNYKLPTPDLTKSNLSQLDEDMKLFMKMLYTISTRGKDATIFVGTGLESFIKTVRLNYKNKLTNFNEAAIAKFRESTKLYIEKIKPYCTPTAPVTTTSGTPTSIASSSSGSITGSGASLSEGVCASVLTDASLLDAATKEILDTTVSEEEEILEESKYKESEKDLKESMLVYGDFSLRGVPLSEDRKSWKNNNSNNDCSIFMNPDEEISDGTRKDEIVRKVLAVKGSLLFKLETYPEEFSSKYDTTKVKYKLVMGPRDIDVDQFIGYSELDSNKMELKWKDGRVPLIYKVVAEFPAVDGGKPARITLGALANPDTYNDSIQLLEEKKESIIRRINYLNSTSKTKGSALEVNKLKKRYARLNYLSKQRPKLVEEYYKLIDKAYNSYINDRLPELDISDIQFSGNTEIRTIYKGNKELQKMRLSGYINTMLVESTIDEGSNIDEKRRQRIASKWFLDALELRNMDGNKTRSWKEASPYVLLSDVYIVNQSEIEDVDGLYCGGKAVIFATTDPSLKTDSDILTAYHLQKTKDVGKQRVRMIHLDNMGYSLAQMCDSHTFGFVAKTRTDKGGGFNKFPSDNRFMGTRMLIGLWNFRANLINFNDVFSANREAIFGKASDELIDTILKEMYSLYKQYKESLITEDHLKLTALEEKQFYVWAENNIPPGSNLTKELVKNINSFNNSTASTLKQFRLGVGGNENGFIIRKLLLPSDSNIYDATKDNYGIYLTPATLNKFLTMSNELFGTLNSLFKLNKVVKNDDGSLSYVPYKPHENIIIQGKDNPSYNIETILKGTNSEFLLLSESQVKDASLIKFIPKIITSLTSRAIAYSKTELVVNPDGTKDLILRSDEDATKRPYKTRKSDEKWEWVKASTIEMKEYTKDDVDKTHPIIHKINVKDLVENGLDLFDMLSLAFHGTTDKFIEAIDSNLFTPQATDAYFKLGFLSDPYTEVGEDWKNFEGIGKIKKCQTNLGFFGLKCAIGLPKFRIKLNGKFESNSIFKDEEDIEDEITPESADDIIFNLPSVYSIFEKIKKEGIIETLGIFPELQLKLLDTSNLEFELGSGNTIKISNGNGFVMLDTDTKEISDYKEFTNTITGKPFEEITKLIVLKIKNTYIYTDEEFDSISKNLKNFDESDPIYRYEVAILYRHILKNGYIDSDGTIIINSIEDFIESKSEEIQTNNPNISEEEFKNLLNKAITEEYYNTIENLIQNELDSIDSSNMDQETHDALQNLQNNSFDFDFDLLVLDLDFEENFYNKLTELNKIIDSCSFLKLKN